MKTRLPVIQACLDYIDQHLLEELDTDQVAAFSGFSKPHFYRLFRDCTGLSAGNYIIRRKMQFAAWDLARGAKVLEVAMRYGYDTHMGFVKAFKRQFNCPPNVYCRFVSSERPRPVSLQEMLEAGGRGLLMEPKIVRRPAFELVGCDMQALLGVSDILRIREMMEVFNRLCLELLYRTVRGSGDICSASTYPDDLRFFSFLGTQGEISGELPEPLTRLSIPACTCAVFQMPRVPLEEYRETLAACWTYIVGTYLPESGYEYDYHQFDLERYPREVWAERERRPTVELHVPIRERRAANAAEEGIAG